MGTFDFLDSIAEGQEIRLLKLCEDGCKRLYEGSASGLREIVHMIGNDVSFLMDVSDDGVLEIKTEEVQFDD